MGFKLQGAVCSQGCATPPQIPISALVSCLSFGFGSIIAGGQQLPHICLLGTTNQTLGRPENLALAWKELCGAETRVTNNVNTGGVGVD